MTPEAVCFWVLVLTPVAGAANVAIAAGLERPPILIGCVAGTAAALLLSAPVFVVALALSDVGPYLARAAALAGLAGGVTDIPLSWWRNVRSGRSLGRIYAEAGAVGLLVAALLVAWNAPVTAHSWGALG
ncbi:hypothetical protein J0H58_36755 [bacterium]|nr:hypothetical protein [bacterium]